MATRTDVNTLGEFGLIRHLTQHHLPRNPTTLRGIGDDAAVLDTHATSSKAWTLVTTDVLVEQIHFDLAYVPLKHLGYKAVAVNVSDIAAMNGVCEQITVGIAFSNRFSVEALDELYDGIYTACRHYGVDLVGGDTTSSLRGLFLSITAIGSVEPSRITYRNTARVGDILCVSGDIGAAYLGLQILEREKQIHLEHPTIQPQLDKYPYIVGRQLRPEARVDIVKGLKEAGIVPTSMIDISDGLASELFHLCKQSHTGAIVEESHLPIHPDTYQTAAIEFQIDPTMCALNGGEDYELLFTVRPEDLPKAQFLYGINIIGEMLPEADGIHLKSKSGKMHPIEAQGWVHF